MLGPTRRVLLCRGVFVYVHFYIFVFGRTCFIYVCVYKCAYLFVYVIVCLLFLHLHMKLCTSLSSYFSCHGSPDVELLLKLHVFTYVHLPAYFVTV
jgi:hypothetical protein